MGKEREKCEFMSKRPADENYTRNTSYIIITHTDIFVTSQQHHTKESSQGTKRYRKSNSSIPNPAAS